MNATIEPSWLAKIPPELEPHRVLGIGQARIPKQYDTYLKGDLEAADELIRSFLFRLERLVGGGAGGPVTDRRIHRLENLFDEAKAEKNHVSNNDRITLRHAQALEDTSGETLAVTYIRSSVHDCLECIKMLQELKVDEETPTGDDPAISDGEKGKVLSQIEQLYKRAALKYMGAGPEDTKNYKYSASELNNYVRLRWGNVDIDNILGDALDDLDSFFKEAVGEPLKAFATAMPSYGGKDSSFIWSNRYAKLYTAKASPFDTAWGSIGQAVAAMKLGIDHSPYLRENGFDHTWAEMAGFYAMARAERMKSDPVYDLASRGLRAHVYEAQDFRRKEKPKLEERSMDLTQQPAVKVESAALDLLGNFPSLLHLTAHVRQGTPGSTRKFIRNAEAFKQQMLNLEKALTSNGDSIVSWAYRLEQDGKPETRESNVWIAV